MLFSHRHLVPGGQEIEVDAPLEHIPLFIRAGGMIPMGKVMKHVGAEPDDVRQVGAFPHPTEGRGVFTLIEDDGITLDYRQGKLAQVQLQIESNRRSISVHALASGHNRLPNKTVEFILPASETRRADARGDEWTDEVSGISW